MTTTGSRGPLARLLLWPGEKACDLVGLTRPDDRQGFRIFANMVLWGVLIVAVAVAVAVSGLA